MKPRNTDDEDLHAPAHEPYKRHHQHWRSLLEEETDEHFEDEEDEEAL
jgi:hypothetical protein